jgi:hypothetical protein
MEYIKNNRNVLNALVERLQKIGIEIELAGNYPWVYLNKINGNRVTETFEANHGFTVAFIPLRDNKNKKMELTDIAEIFKLIRKYTK